MHYYKILKHKAGFDEGTSYWEKLLARYLAATGGGKIRTTLPITFTSTSWKLVSWTIYGNNTPNNYSAEGTLPLTFTTHTAGAASDWVIEGNDEIGKNLLEITATSEETAHNGIKFTVDKENGIVIANGRATAKRTFNVGLITNDTSEPIDYYLSGGADGGTEASYFLIGTNGNVRLKKWNGTTDMSGSTSLTNAQEMQIPAGVTGIIRIYIRNGTVCENLVFKPMIRLPDTSADFEPYQVGVGQRTKNLFDKNATDVNKGYVNPGRLRADGTINTSPVSYDIWVTEYIPVNAESQYTLVDLIATSSFGLCYYKNDKTYISGKTYSGVTNHGNKTVTTPADCKYIRFTTAEDYDTMLVEGSTAPQTFIPYGYEIPLTVNNTTQDIYIGSTPLTAGQSVSKTSTGIDIATQSGANTITTELYNKPSMAITGVDYVGVGERTKNLVPPIRTANGWKQGYRRKTDGKYMSTHNSGEWLYDVYVPIDSTSFTFWATAVSGDAAGTFYFYDSNKDYLPNTVINLSNYNNVTISNLPSNAVYMQFAFRTFCMSEQEIIDNNYQVMLVKGSTAPQTFIPYGYQIPLTISQTGQTDKNYDIYIGASPLTEGQTVSDTTEIEVFEGENTIDTTLYNKPEMEITYE